MAGVWTRSVHARRWLSGRRRMGSAAVPSHSRGVLVLDRRMVLGGNGGGAVDGLARNGGAGRLDGRSLGLGAGDDPRAALCRDHVRRVPVSWLTQARGGSAKARGAPRFLCRFDRRGQRARRDGASAGKPRAHSRAARLGSLRARPRATADREVRGVRHHRSVPARCSPVPDQSSRVRARARAVPLHAELPRLSRSGAAKPRRDLLAAQGVGLLGLRIDVGTLQLQRLRSRAQRQHHAHRLVRHARRRVHAELR